LQQIWQQEVIQFKINEKVSKTVLTHEEVMEEAGKSLPNFKKLLKEIITNVEVPKEEIYLNENKIKNEWNKKQFPIVPSEEFNSLLKDSQDYIEKFFENVKTNNAVINNITS
jgi:hypothetical protein